jgi:prepilin-type N-terminal cleavage/methylation domain-containing protein
VRQRRSACSGFTLLEVILGLSLLAILLVKVAMAVNSANRFTAEGSSAVVLEDQARAALDRIAYAIMGSDRNTLIPDVEAPLHCTDLDFRVSLGVDDGGVIVWDDPERIGLGDSQNQLTWRSNPGLPEERRVVWSNLVRDLLEGELPNGVDDNGNGLIDEKGLAFVIFRNSVTIRLTLEKPGPGGRRMTETVQTTVTCRNLGGGA